MNISKLLQISTVLDVCDVGEDGQKIIATTSFKSQQSYNPRRGLRVANILADQFELHHFSQKKIIEFGPGHYAFALLARHLGAEVVCIERDPAFAALGRYLGFQVLEGNFSDILTSREQSLLFDGLWMKGSFNSCAKKDELEIQLFVAGMTKFLSSSSWAWVTTVNKASQNIDIHPNFVKTRIELQRDAFYSFGWDISLIDDVTRSRYALNYSGSLYYFTRNILPPGKPWLAPNC